MKLYNVTFKWYETDTFCSNLVKAETEEDISAYYRTKYGNDPIITEASTYALEDAQRRGKPVVTVPAFYGVNQAAEITEPENNENNEEKKEMENTAKTRSEVIEEIKTYFEENEDSFIDCIEELDSWNGYLGDDRYYSMDELSGLYADADPMTLLQRAFYGYDAETWTTDSHGEKQFGAFNPNREYFSYNGYGNLVSSDYKDYSAFLDHWFIEKLEENRQHVYAIKENIDLDILFDDLESAEED